MFGRRKREDFSAEIRAHIELEAERLREQGLSEEQARSASLRLGVGLPLPAVTAPEGRPA